MSPRSERRYGNPPKIKLAMPTAAEAQKAAPKPDNMAGTAGIPVTATPATAGSVKI